LTDTTQFLYTVHPVRAEMLTEGPTPLESEVVTRHFDYLQKLTAADVVILAGRTLNTDSSSFGIVIFNAGSTSEAEEIMRKDPAVINGVMRARLYPYRVALMGSK